MNENKFDGMGNIYAKFRPNYPEAFLQYLYDNLAIKPSHVMADIGAGTGILTQQLLQKGNKVFAVEPNNDMRTVAKHNLHDFTNFVLVNGTAENTTLESGSVDFITVAQAFHWFDEQTFKQECKRILSSNGKVILVWNSRDTHSEIVQLIDTVNQKYCPNFKGFSEGVRGAVGEDDFSDFFFEDYQSASFDNPLPFDEQGFIGRNLSSSYALKEQDKNYSRYVSELKAIFEAYQNNKILVLPNITRAYIGTV